MLIGILDRTLQAFPTPGAADRPVASDMAALFENWIRSDPYAGYASGEAIVKCGHYLR